MYVNLLYIEFGQRVDMNKLAESLSVKYKSLKVKEPKKMARQQALAEKKSSDLKSPAKKNNKGKGVLVQGGTKLDFGDDPVSPINKNTDETQDTDGFSTIFGSPIAVTPKKVGTSVEEDEKEEESSFDGKQEVKELEPLCKREDIQEEEVPHVTTRATRKHQLETDEEKPLRTVRKRRKITHDNPASSQTKN